jgi:hypothetical protein
MLRPAARNRPSHESWLVKNAVSDWSRLPITSANPGMDPVVIAFIRGSVTVGGATCAVNGTAAPLRIKLLQWNSAKILLR